MRIDAHHHLWHFDPAAYPWIGEGMDALRHDFTPAALHAEMQRAGIDAAIAVQARESLAENDMLLASAEQAPWICGVVGWLPLTSDDFASLLARYSAHPLFVGVREMVQAHPTGFLDHPAIAPNLRALTRHGLSFDLILRPDQLVEATCLVDRHPGQRFILDHAGKPPLRTGELARWSSDLRELARRPNVVCKLSGLVTEAHWQRWTPADITPILDLCVEAFTPQRLLAASDWPVCLLATSYARWWHLLDEHFAAFSATERAALFGGNALSAYRLPLPAPHEQAA